MIDYNAGSEDLGFQVLQRLPGIKLQLVEKPDTSIACDNGLHRKIVVIDQQLSRQISDQAGAADSDEVP